jgi:BlaI family transcriptional regulator, penicillinase repressor
VARSDHLDLRGDLQAEVMRIVWRLGEATVDDVRAAQPKRSRCAYTTIQTVLNRLVERDLLERERRGKAFAYRAAYDESELLARSIGLRLADASLDARRAVVLNLVEALEPEELDDVARLANRIRRERKGR